jgi:hypothetical protein
MARAARKQLADMRALEWEASRENIIDPRRATTEEMLTEEEMAGSGATPSMGLSVVRGGAKHREAEEAGRKLRKYLTKLHGHGYAEAFAGGCGCSGGKKSVADCEYTERECDDDEGIYDHATKECIVDGEPETKPGCGEAPVEPDHPDEPDVPSAKPTKLIVPLWKADKVYEMGTIVRLHTIGSQTDALWQATAKVAAGVKPAPDVPLWKKISDQAVGSGATPSMGLSTVRGGAGIVGGSNNVAPRSGNISHSGTYEGLGRRVESESEEEEMEGGHCPSRAHLRAEVTGLGRRKKAKRAPASAGDGRRKRAEIVKKVMAEKGLKMIEASKYVKDHHLY